MRRIVVAMTLAVAMVLATAPAAFAGGDATDQERKEAAGWGCGENVGLPDGHCISSGTAKNFEKTAAKGGTFQLQVFNGDGNFLTAEVATFKTSADNRPCPNDPDSPDGTYWDFVAGTLWVCHHQPG